LYNNIVPASKLPTGSDYHLFREGIEPKWEDSANSHGGNWLFVSQGTDRSKLDTAWLNVLLAIIGEKFADEIPGAENQICGFVVSVRQKLWRVSLWTRDASVTDVVKQIGTKLKEVLFLEDGGTTEKKIQYISHQAEMEGKKGHLFEL